MNDLEVREERHLSVEEFYEVNGIPEKEREEFEFIAGALTISYYRTMKEAFKIGGYAWHAHKRFEALKDGWSFEKTVEWLKTLGIVFNETSIKRFINVYVTYLGADSSNTTLRESYVLVKEAFKLGGYAWHAHKRFEEIKNGWTFEKTVEWLGSMGMDFCRSSIGRLVNFYSTYVCDREVLATSLRDSYTLVNQQADEVVGLPSRMKIIERIFTALPSDDSTNLEWFTHPGLIPFLIPLLIPDN